MVNPDTQMTAHILAVLLRNDRKPRIVGVQRTRQEWGLDRMRDYLRAIGADILERDGEAALWGAMREVIALLPHRRQEGLIRLVYAWSTTGKWLADQDREEPAKPEGYRPPAVAARYGGG
jgi:hypothetical protein